MTNSSTGIERCREEQRLYREMLSSFQDHPEREFWKLAVDDWFAEELLSSTG